MLAAMKKLTIFTCVAIILLAGLYKIHEENTKEDILRIEAQVQQLTTQLQSTKSEMIQLELRQSVAEDISDRAGWR